MQADEKMRILFLSRWFPYPPDNGSKLRIFNLLRGLGQKHTIHLLSFAGTDEAPTGIPEPLSAICDTVRVVPWKDYNPASRQALRGLFSPAPRSITDTYSGEMQAAIEAVCAAHRIDLVIASQIDMAAYRPAFKDLPAIFEEAEVGVYYEQFSQAKRPLARLRYGLTWSKYKRFLAALIGDYQLTTVVSAREKHLLQRAIGLKNEKIDVIPNCVDYPSYTAFQTPAEPNRLIFTGSLTFSPNYQAMDWFLREVYPLIQAGAPEVVHLTITGNHANLPLPQNKDVSRAGYVEDVRPLIAKSWLSLAPILKGGGTRLKILEALALGTPVVSTAKGAEGLEVQNGEHLIIADTPTDFSRAVLLLLENEGERRRLSENGKQLVQEKYDWGAVLPGFLDRISTLIS